jgi:hypothetical protein
VAAAQQASPTSGADQQQRAEDPINSLRIQNIFSDAFRRLTQAA